MTLPSDAAVAAIEAGFLDECEIRWQSTLGAYDPDTNTQPVVPGNLVWSGPCQYSEAGNQGRELARGGEAELEHPYQFSIPRQVAPSPGLFVTLTAVHADGDTAALDHTFIIRRIRYGTRSARRILLCDLLQSATGTAP